MTEFIAQPTRTYALVVGIEKYQDGSLNRPLAKILERPLPNPLLTKAPVVKGREQDFKFPPFIRGD
jgi:hypothetical protein